MNQGNLQAVEINDHSSDDIHISFFLDFATSDTLKKLFLMYFLFLLTHIIGCWIAPSNFEESSKVYPIVEDSKIKFVEVDVTLLNLEQKNHLVTAYGQLLRKNVQNEETISLNITSRSMFNYKYVNVNLTEPFNFEATVNFPPNSKCSSSFLIFNKSVTNYDLVQNRLNVGGDFTNIEAFNFSWKSMNPNSERFLSFGKLLCFFLYIYLLVFFVPLRKFQIEPPTQKLVSILFIFGILASIPTTLFFYDQLSYLFEYLSSSLFIGIFRIFCSTQVLIPYNKGNKNQKNVVKYLSVFFIFASIFDVATRYLKFFDKDKPYELQNSSSLIGLINSIIHTIASALLFMNAFRVLRDNNKNPRCSIMSLFSILSSIVTILTEMIAYFLRLTVTYIWPEMFFILFHLVSAAFLAYLFHPVESLQYENVINNKGSKLNPEPNDSVDLFDDE